MPRAQKPGWTSAAFGDVVSLSRERSTDPKRDGLERYVGLEHLDPGDLKIRRWGEVGDGTTFTNVFRAGQVLFGKRRAYQRKVAVADFKGVCSSDIYVFESKSDHLVPDLLPFICQSDAFFEHAVGTSDGSLSPRTNWDSLKSFELELPPIASQRQIARACRAALSASDAYAAAAEHSATLLQSFLAHMTQEFSASNQSVAALVASGAIADPQDGNHGELHPKASDYVSNGIPFIMAADLGGGRVDLITCHFIRPETAEGLRIGFAREGDVLLTHKGTLGETAILVGLTTEYAMLTPQVTYYRVTDRTQLLPKYLWFAFQSPAFQHQLASRGQQSTRAFVGITDQRNLVLPVPPITDQLRIVQVLGTLDSAHRAAIERAAASKVLATLILRDGLKHSGIAA